MQVLREATTRLCVAPLLYHETPVLRCVAAHPLTYPKFCVAANPIQNPLCTLIPEAPVYTSPLHVLTAGAARGRCKRAGIARRHYSSFPANLKSTFLRTLHRM